MLSGRRINAAYPLRLRGKIGCDTACMLLKDCPVSTALRVIGGKWKPLILNELKSGPLSFGQLQRRIPEASHKVLNEQLRQLQEAGIVTKATYKQSVMRSSYSLSESGQTLRPVLNQLASWGQRAKKRASSDAVRNGRHALSVTRS